MLYKKMLPIFLTHFLFAYGFGNQIYGFDSEPNKWVIVVLSVILLALASYVGENKLSGALDGFLGILQATLAAISGMADVGSGFQIILLPAGLLSGAIIICYFRVRRKADLLSS